MRPQSGARRNADQPEADADRQTEGGVERDLRQKEPAQPLTGLVEGGGGPLNVLGSGEPDEPIPEILALQQDEDHEDHDNPGGRKRRQQGFDDRNQCRESAWIRLFHFNGDRFIGRLPQRAAGPGCPPVSEFCSSVLRSLRTLEARSNVPEPPVNPRRLSTLSRRVCW